MRCRSRRCWPAPPARGSPPTRAEPRPCSESWRRRLPPRAELTLAGAADDLPEAGPEQLRALALGQPVAFDLDDALLTALPQKVAAAVHGIVREALTNARVHVPGAPVRVRLIASPNGDSALLTVVSEPADGPRRPGSGRGLAGMRRRAQSVGGSFDAGNAVGGAFRVAARLPC